MSINWVRRRAGFGRCRWWRRARLGRCRRRGRRHSPDAGKSRRLGHADRLRKDAVRGDAHGAHLHAHQFGRNSGKDHGGDVQRRRGLRDGCPQQDDPCQRAAGRFGDGAGHPCAFASPRQLPGDGDLLDRRSWRHGPRDHSERSGEWRDFGAGSGSRLWLVRNGGSGSKRGSNLPHRKYG